jgi:uncharacterized repeat protein (TIGR03803 family)
VFSCEWLKKYQRVGLTQGLQIEESAHPVPAISTGKTKPSKQARTLIIKTPHLNGYHIFRPGTFVLILLCVAGSLSAIPSIAGAIYSFSALDEDYFNSDGADPVASLVLSGKTLYGTAQYGGTNGSGTVFSLSTDGTVFSDLYSFSGTDTNFINSDGAGPVAGLVLSGNALYGTAEYGGTAGNGTVFSLNTDGTGFTNLYSFSATNSSGINSDGAAPFAGLILSGNTLYGTAEYGGSNGYGAVFSINIDGTGFTNLYSFSAIDTNYFNSDGADPVASLVLSGNTLYGTANYGGTAGNGTLFSLNSDGTGFTNLHSFSASDANYVNSDGLGPVAGLILSGNTLYGTAEFGGSAGNGTVFSVHTDGLGFTNLRSFPATNSSGINDDGAGPFAGLVLSGGTLYGTAEFGGSAGNGTVFSVHTDGTGFSNLYSFTATNSSGINSDGANPLAALIFSGNTLYGTAVLGGSASYGTVYSLTVTVTTAVPVVTWTRPAGIVYGTPLTTNQLNATATVPGSFAYNPPSGTVLGVGNRTLSVIFTPTDMIDYRNASNTVSLVVSPAPLTVTAANMSRAFGQGNPALTGTIIGVKNGDDITATYSTTATVGSPAGGYSIVPTLVDPHDRITNYTVSLVNGTLTVTQAVPLVTWTNPVPIIYGTALNSEQLDAAANVPGSFAYNPTNGSVLNAGTNTLSVIFTPSDTVDYSSATNIVSVVVANAPLTVTAANTNRPFGVANPVFTGTIIGLVNGDNITAAYNCIANSSSPVGLYPIVPSLLDPSDRQTNYTVSLIDGTLEVGTITLAVTWTNPAPMIYGAPLTSNQLNATANVPGSFSYIPTNGSVLNAGTNILSAIFTPNDTTAFNSATNMVELVVSPAPLTVTAGSTNREYGQVNPMLSGTITGLTNGDDITAAYSCSATTGSPVGAYSILPSLVDPNDRQTNYTVNLVNGTLTVTPAVPLVTWTDPIPIIYGTSLNSGQLDAAASVPGNFAYNPTNGSVLNTGTNSLSVIFTPSDTLDYGNATNIVSVVVSNAPLTVTAANTSRPIGEANPVFTGTITGVVNGDNITAAYSCGANSSSTVGFYPIVPSLVDPSDRQTNYTVSLIDGTLTVGTITLMVTWTNPAPMIYGAPLTSNQLNATANVPGSFAYIPTNGAVLNAGTNILSAIFTPSDTTEFNNATNTVELVVSPAPLTVTAGSTNREYGQVNPMLSGTITGLTNGDDITATYSCSATAGSPVGGYLILPSLVDPNDRQTNYTVNPLNGTLTVTQAVPLVIWTNPVPIIYGTALNSEQLDAAANVPGSFAYNPTNGSVLNIGTIALSVIFTPSDAVDYASATNTVSVVVSNAPLTVTAANASRAFRKANPVFTGTITGLVNGDDITAAYSCSANSSSPVGLYPIVPSLMDPSDRLTNYTVSLIDGTLEVGTITLAVTWTNPAPIIYGAPLTSNQLNATANVPGSFAYIPTNAAVLDAGTNILSAIFTPDDTTAFDIVTNTVELVVSTAPLTVTAASTNRQYGQVNPMLSGTVTGLTNGDDITANYACAATLSSAVGVYSVVPSLVDPENRQTNYTVNLVDAMLTVTQAPVSITWPVPVPIIYGASLTSNQLNATTSVPGAFAYLPTNGTVLGAGTYTLSTVFTPADTTDFSGATNTVSLVVSPAPLTVTAANTNRAYGQANPVFAGAVVGVTNGDNITAAYSCSATTASPLGAYSIVQSLVDPNDRQTNYTVSIVNGTLTVTQAVPLVTWTNPVPIIYGTALNSNQLDAAANVPGSFAYNPTNDSVLNAGTNSLSAIFTPSDTVDYGSATNTVSLVVSNAPLIMTAGNASRPFGHANPVFTGTITGVTNGDNITAAYNCSANSSSPVGLYPIVPSLVDPSDRQTNYTVSLIDGTLEVGTITLTVTWTNPAPIIYGAPLTSNQLNATANVPGSFAFIPTNGAVLNTGTNILSAIFTPYDTTAFESATNTVELVVSPAPLTVAAANTNRAYGEANPAFSGTMIGLTNGDNITASYSCAATLSSAVGVYSIVPSLIDPENRQTNYTVNLVDGMLTVTQAPVSITWATPVPIVYGTSLTSNQLDATTSVPGAFAYLPTNGTVLGTGTYTLSTVFTPADTTDYSGATNTVSLVVSPAPLTVTAANTNRTYGQSNPVFAGAVVGVTNGDNITAAYSCSATTGSPVGGYSIVPSLVDPNDRQTNYTVSLVNGTLTVTQAVPLVTWTNPVPIIYGAALNSNQLDAAASVPGSFAYNPTNGSVLNAGTNALSAIFTPSDAVDYGSATNTVSLIISNAPLTVTAASTNRPYGEANPVFTGVITGLTNGDNITASYSTAATNDSPAGTYPIVPSLVDPDNRQTNYTITLIAGTLTVTLVQPNFSSATVTGNQLEMVLTGETGQQYALERSTNLINWSPLITNTVSANGTVNFTDTPGTNNSQSVFYRALLVP